MEGFLVPHAVFLALSEDTNIRKNVSVINLVNVLNLVRLSRMCLKANHVDRTYIGANKPLSTQ